MQGSYANIAAFTLHRPSNLDELGGLVRDLGNGAVMMAGGVDLLQRLKDGEAPAHLVYLKAVDELRRIDVADGVLRLGACVTHHRLATDAVVRANMPALAAVWSDIANARVRIAGTIGGNLLAGNPTYDGLPAMIALDAAAVFEDADGPVRVRVDEPWGGRGVLTALEIPVTFSRRLAFDRTLKPTVAVAVALASAAGKLESARVGIGCAHARPLGGALAIEAGASLDVVAKSADRLAASFVDGLPEPLDNHVASAAYRRRMIATLLARQLRVLCEA